MNKSDIEAYEKLKQEYPAIMARLEGFARGRLTPGTLALDVIKDGGPDEFPGELQELILGAAKVIIPAIDRAVNAPVVDLKAVLRLLLGNDWLPENPYFDSAMSIESDKEYAAALPDPTLRTAVSWYIGNRTWKVAMRGVMEALRGLLEDAGVLGEEEE